jgi:hypothetical protein
MTTDLTAENNTHFWFWDLVAISLPGVSVNWNQGPGPLQGYCVSHPFPASRSCPLSVAPSFHLQNHYQHDKSSLCHPLTSVSHSYSERPSGSMEPMQLAQDQIPFPRFPSHPSMGHITFPGPGMRMQPALGDIIQPAAPNNSAYGSESPCKITHSLVCWLVDVFVCFGGTVVWTQGLYLLRRHATTWVIPSASFTFTFFLNRVLHLWLDYDPPSNAFHEARMTGAHHYTQLLLEMRVSPAVCLGWPWTMIFLFSSWLAGITNVDHHAQPTFHRLQSGSQCRSLLLTLQSSGK